MILYKYCRPDRIDILRSGRIALTRPRAFNDPFELQPHISKFEDPADMVNDVLERTGNFVVLSLAENCESLLMWAHYTDCYRGFLIGFEGPANNILLIPSEQRDSGPVFYCHHRPSHAKWKEVEDHELFYTKSSDWSYEREWRIVDSLYSADGQALDAESNCWPFQIRTSAVRFVIVGHRCSILSEIVELLGAPRYEPVELVMATPDRQRFELLFYRYERASWDALAAGGNPGKLRWFPSEHRD